MAENQQGKFYFGWYVVVVAFILLAVVGAPGISMSGLPVVSIVQDFKVSVTNVMLMGALSMMGAMIGTLFAGKVFMRFGLRKTVSCGLILSGAMWLLISTVKDFKLMIVMAFIAGVIGTFTTTLPASIVINNWFGPKLRGKAMGVTIIGLSAGAVVLSPVVAKLITSATWRGAYRMYGILAWVMIPFVFLTFYDTPAAKGIIRQGDIPGEKAAKKATGVDPAGMTAGEALRTPIFWILVVALFIINGLGAAWNGNGPTFLTTIGYTQVRASFLISLCSLAAIIAKIIYGIYNDINGCRKTFNMFLIPVISASICLILSPKMPALAYAAAVLYGLSFPNSTVGSPLITGELFGPKNYSILVGYTQFVASLGSAIFPMIVSSIYGATGNYVYSWAAVLVLSLLALVLINITYVAKKNYISNKSTN